MTKTSPADGFWGINITSSTYGTDIVIPTSTAGIVDTGTTRMFSSLLLPHPLYLTWTSCSSVLLLADDFFAVYMDAIPGATLDVQTGLIEIPASSVSQMKSLNFTIGGQVFSMDVAAQLIPTDQNTAYGGVAGKQYGVVSNTGSNSGEGLDFTIGQKFMERFYAVSSGSSLAKHVVIDSIWIGLRHGC